VKGRDHREEIHRGISKVLDILDTSAPLIPKTVFLGSPRIDSKESIPPAYVARAGILKQSMGARNRIGKGLSYRPAGLPSLADLIYWNRFLGSINV
jgi:hypothetical protein